MIDRLPPQHPDRLAMANELHARPFPELTAPCRAVRIALMPRENAAERDPQADLDHLIALIDRFGGQHPPPGANHYSGELGRLTLKWERHTEFVTYTLFSDGVAQTPFDGATAAFFPPDWLASAPGVVVSATLVRIEAAESEQEAEQAVMGRLSHYFSKESIATSWVADRTALVCGDFRVHEDGMSRFAVVVTPSIGPRRLGRIAQRVLEIETYKSVAMLTLPVARRVARRLSEIDRELAALIESFADGESDDVAGGERATLNRLTRMSAEIEAISADSAFRFGAAGAYESIVAERIESLREERVRGRQSIAEFMSRRFDPAMRTCRSAQGRLYELSTRAARAADLLRTRVDVAVSDQNRQLLESMDRRAALQLRLQQTVEGLSVVAISYYAVSLAGYLFAPIGHAVGVDKAEAQAAATIPIVLAVWAFVRRIRRRIEKD